MPQPVDVSGGGPVLPDAIAFLGFGLIGGSIARAIREREPAPARRRRLVAWTPSGHGAGAALREGLIDAAPERLADAIVSADLIILAAPPLAVLDLLDQLGGPLRSALALEATITDVTSTKGAVVARADGLGLRFVGGHPMAGREASGASAASPDLFTDRPWVIVAGAHAQTVDVERVGALAASVGARPVEMSAGDHDAAVAAISHLPLVASVALVEAMAADARSEWPAARALAAGGWRDMTRLAAGSPDMGAGILATNATATASALHAYREAIDGWLGELERDGGPDPTELAIRLRAVRARLAESP